MIPKIIHYCWFGPKKMPKKFKKFILKWKSKLPEYDFILWDDHNFDFSSSPFLQKAYREKKWAFISDYVRLNVLYIYGGVYLDTDMEIIERFDELLNKDLILGFENGLISTGFIASSKNNIHIRELLKNYSTLDFYGIPNTKIFTEYFFGDLKFDIWSFYETDEYIIYPIDYFCCNNCIELFVDQNSKFIHHYSASWIPIHKRVKEKIKILLIKLKIFK